MMDVIFNGTDITPERNRYLVFHQIALENGKYLKYEWILIVMQIYFQLFSPTTSILKVCDFDETKLNSIANQ
jgi:hypothetical protein